MKVYSVVEPALNHVTASPAVLLQQLSVVEESVDQKLCMKGPELPAPQALHSGNLQGGTIVMVPQLPFMNQKNSNKGWQLATTCPCLPSPTMRQLVDQSTTPL